MLQTIIDFFKLSKENDKIVKFLYEEQMKLIKEKEATTHEEVLKAR
jgi:hypothetical protein